MESGATAGEVSQAKRDEVVEGVGDGKPVARNAGDPVASTVERSGSGSGESDDSVSQVRSSSSEKLCMVGGAEVGRREGEEEIPSMGQTEQAGPGSATEAAEGQSGSSSEAEDAVAAGDGGG